MTTTDGGAGLQELMAAENQASAIIAEARAARIERMKDAKRDAKAMIDAFRVEKESVYQSSVQQNAGEMEAEGTSIKQQTDSEIQIIHKQYQDNERPVRDMLVKEIVNVTYRLPENRKRTNFHG